MLPPMERVGLPGECRVVVISSDATPSKLGAIDWTHRFVFREDAEIVKAWVTRVTDQELLGGEWRGLGHPCGGNVVLHCVRM